MERSPAHGAARPLGLPPAVGLLLWLCSRAVPAAAEPAGPASSPLLPLPDEWQLAADRLTLDLAGGEHRAEGVRVTAGALAAAAASAVVEPTPWRLRLRDVRLRLELPEADSWSAAGAAAVLDAERLEVQDGVFSRCPLERTGWRVSFARACAAPDGDVVVEDAVLRLFDVPVLWTPWALLRFGRLPGLLPPELGSRQERGPFLRLGAFLPAGALGDFELTATGFPLDDADLAAGWTSDNGRVDLGAARVADAPRAFLRAELVVPTGTRGGFVSRGVLAQSGFAPADTVETSGDAAFGPRFPALRTDRFLLAGDDFWTVAAGIGSWQPVVGGTVAGGEIALPRATLAWTPGLLDDSLRLPGAVRLAAWRPMGDLLSDSRSAEHVLVLAWRQTLEVAPPLAPGLDLRPLFAAAGRHDEPGPSAESVDRLWLAAGARAALAFERSWNGGAAYHRVGLDLRYLRVLPVGLDPLGDHLPLGPGPDLLRVGVPQTLRLGELTVAADVFWELRRLDAWEDAAVTFGAEVEAWTEGVSISGVLALDGAALPATAAADVRLPVTADVEIDLRYAWLGTGVGSAALFLPWERRLAEAAEPGRVVRHGLGGDLRLGAAGSRASLLLGAEFDLEAVRPAALRFGLSLADPDACVALDLVAQFWLDDPVPNVSLGLRL
ncbi:MAG: hypothetical protein JXB32_02400 [Deltaproteobacteria bacterium]|nr:hypothetical protein [Deltaproteobacteria bacterium]